MLKIAVPQHCETVGWEMAQPTNLRLSKDNLQCLLFGLVRVTLHLKHIKFHLMAYKIKPYGNKMGTMDVK